MLNTLKNKKEILDKLKTSNINYKLVPSTDYDDLVLYPDNYNIDNIWFCLYRFYDIGKTQIIAEDSDGNYYGKFVEDEFLLYVKNFKLNSDN